jgi:multidrug efflux pump subunit AcrA (membrane-fusion protein)
MKEGWAMQSKLKILLFIIIPLVIIILAIVGIRSLRNARDTEAQPSPEMLAVVERGAIEVWVTGSGVIRPVAEEVVMTTIGGTIDQYYLEDNMSVNAGDELVVLKTQDSGLQVEKLRNDISALEIDLEKLKDEGTLSFIIVPGKGSVLWLIWEGDLVNRGDIIARFTWFDDSGTKSYEKETIDIQAPGPGTVTELRVQNDEIVNGSQVLGVIDDLERAVAIEQQIAAKELQVRQLEQEIHDLLEMQAETRENSVITAPISGTLVIPEPNNFATGMNVPQGTVLATIVDYSTFEVTIPIDELDINKIEIGKDAEITVDALPGDTLVGEVINIADRGQNVGGIAVFEVTVAITRAEGLKAAMSASVSILTEIKLNTLLVPIEAVTEVEGVNTVLVFEQNQESGKSEVSSVIVETGIYNSSSIEILSGLQEGQQVAIQSIQNGFENLRPGQSGPFVRQDE